MSQDLIREQFLAVTRDKYKLGPTDPKIWFVSMDSMTEVLADENHVITKIIKGASPGDVL